ncbi:MAG: hypothetical protein M3P38_03175 [Chloroflexota bacterium]|nr:hypothetical protein [Chloroflexota bacterium]
MRFKALARLLVVVTASVLVAGLPSAHPNDRGREPSAECRSPAPPLGALPPAGPAWCDSLAPGIDTANRKANSWSDGFASGVSHARLSASYLVFEDVRRATTNASTSVYRTQEFAHNGHWMVDIAGHGAPSGIYEGSAADFYTGPNNGGSLMRPDAGFRFADGRLVVEFDASAGMTTYDDRVWPEIVVTTAPGPSDRETNGWYAAGLFGGYPTVGCAFPSDRLSECRIYDTERITANLSAHASGGAANVFGGAPTSEPLKSAWRLCGTEDLDTACRDHFRIEMARDSIAIFVNGVRYMEHRGLPPSAQIPDELLRSSVYVYFASWAYLVEATVARVHWGRIAVNPDPLMR